MADIRKSLPKLNENNLSLAASGQLQRIAELDSRFERQFKKDLAGINSFINDFNYSPVLRHMNELAEQQKTFRTIIEDVIKPSSFLQISKQITEITHPFSQLGRNYSNQISGLAGIAKIFEEQHKAIDAFKSQLLPITMGVDQSLLKLAQPLNDLNNIVNSFRPSAFENITKQLQVLDTAELQSIVRGLTDDSEFEDINNLEFATLKDTEIIDIEDEIQDVLQNPHNVPHLSLKAKRILYFLFAFLIWPLILNLSANHIYNSMKPQQNHEININALARELKAELEPSLISNYRLVRGDGLRLREEPAMNSEVILHLGLGQLLLVIDKGLKSWIMVEVQINDQTHIGWVSRRYTKHLH